MWIEPTILNKFVWFNRLWCYVRNLFWSVKGTWSVSRICALLTFAKALLTLHYFNVKTMYFIRDWICVQGDQNKSFNLSFHTFLFYDRMWNYRVLIEESDLNLWFILKLFCSTKSSDSPLTLLLAVFCRSAFGQVSKVG